MVAVSDTEKDRRSDSVLRIIHDHPGLTAKAIGQLMGSVAAREIRDRIQRLRSRGYRITCGPMGGYYDLEAVTDGKQAAELVKFHMARTRDYLIDHATLLKQIGKMTSEEAAERMLFDVTIPREDADADRELGPEQLAQLPSKRRAGYTRVLCALLDRLQSDPAAFSVERAYLADRYGKIFLTKGDAAKLAAARKLLEEIGA